MGLFGNRKLQALEQALLPKTQAPSLIPVAQIDPSKRYDVYCVVANEERLYENVKFLSIQCFDRPPDYIHGVVGGYLEIEAEDGSKMLIPHYGIQLLCEHGTEPVYHVLRRWGPQEQG